MQPFLERAVHKIPVVLSFPSIALAAFVIYVIYYQSPKSMRDYKIVLITITLVILNFDMSMSIFIGPKPLPGAFGTENNGFLPLLWPSGGRIHMWYVCLSMILQFEICVIGFSYREHTILRNKLPSWHRIYTLFQWVVFVSIVVIMTLLYVDATVDDVTGRKILVERGSTFCRECSLCVIPDGHSTIYAGSLTLVSALILNFFIGVSIYRIKRVIRLERANLSENTVRMQNMLLKALIWQYLTPFVLVAIPTVVLGAGSFGFSVVTNNFEPKPIEEDITAISFIIPCLFSICHAFCVINFTVPYRNYVLGLLTKKREEVSRLAVSEAASTTRIFSTRIS